MVSIIQGFCNMKNGAKAPEVVWNTIKRIIRKMMSYYGGRQMDIRETETFCGLGFEGDMWQKHDKISSFTESWAKAPYVNNPQMCYERSFLFRKPKNHQGLIWSKLLNYI